MRLCIPTLCNYDGVDALIRSAEAGTQRPSGYVVLDNGGGYPLMRLHAMLGTSTVSRELITPGKNLGVAASWNLLLERYGASSPIVISNDDITLGPTAFALLADRARTHLIAGFGWALFVQTPECTRRVGYYDENFWPAYHEDIDYILRMQRVGIPECRLEGLIDIEHAGWRTTTALGNPDWLAHGRLRNHSYFIAKWGAEANDGNFAEPFDGKPPPGWDLRKPLPPLPLRWDVLNAIARRIGAKRYLELGLGDGTCIRQVDVADRTGVDPALPPPDAGDAVVFASTTDDFFAVTDQKFDLVFIDADHRAEQVYRDVQNSLRCLNPGGVIVLHDCSPHSEEMQRVPHSGSYAWTGDVWKTILRLRREGQHLVRVVNSDYGIGILIPTAGSEAATPSAAARRELLHLALASLSYAELAQNRKAWLGFLSGWEWEEWFARAYRQEHGPWSDAAHAKRLDLNARLARVAAPASAATDPVRINLGSSDAHLPGYLNVDRVAPADLIADLTERWPWEDHSVDELRAFDCIEHLPDKIHTMNEAWRVLKPGGLFHIFVPTTDGRGAWQDPTHVSYWNRNSFWYYESGNAHRERFGPAYGVTARFLVQGESVVEDAAGQITHLDIRLRADKTAAEASAYMTNIHDQYRASSRLARLAPSAPTLEIVPVDLDLRPSTLARLAAEAQRDTLVVIFDQRFRADTTGSHLLKALSELVPTLHYDPCIVKDGKPEFSGYAGLDLTRARAILCIDDDIGWPLPETVLDLPLYYWCIDSHRIDVPLWIGGTRRERIPRFQKVFYAQKSAADAARAPWLPHAVDTALYTHAPYDLYYDWCFIGNIGPARQEFLAPILAAFPKAFMGQLYGADANRRYNQSRLALNLATGADLNMRAFEAQATSALLLSVRVLNGEAELFSHLPHFTDVESCLAAMHLFLTNEPLRLALSEHQAHDMRAHTYAARARALLTAIGWPGYGA